MTKISPDTPFERFKKTYTPLYRTLLILSGIAALMSLSALTNLRTTIGHFADDPMYATSAIISTLVVPAFMISSLILLWHKHPTGIRLRISGYGVSIIASVIGLSTSPETLARVTKDIIDATVRDGNGAITHEFAANITEVSFYGSLYIAIGASLLFAWLWWKAWDTQMKVDAKKTRDA